MQENPHRQTQFTANTFACSVPSAQVKTSEYYPQAIPRAAEGKEHNPKPLIFFNFLQFPTRAEPSRPFNRRHLRNATPTEA
jgi:hypothetical protein